MREARINDQLAVGQQLVLQDILTAIAVREDKAFMRDDGTGDTPIGMKSRATQWNRLLPWEAGSTINLNTVDEYLDTLLKQGLTQTVGQLREWKVAI